ncbi:MAG: hypothetical protein CR982_07555 [Candidatus Cloacimonadota bacterium]|nr:MAG: hypothetical protein CR982_07555 [Candidatus Cloacimonadota bacterium]PIE80186.1 MAG: hypothetical protein CSA15_02200 [Candidatus Delongbacteria bacterium]
MQQKWANVFGPDASGPYAGKSYWVATYNWSGQNYPVSTGLYNNSGGFGNGYVPLFGVVGKGYRVFYNDNNSNLDAAMKDAIDSFDPNYIFVDNPIEDIAMNVNETMDIDISDVFSAEPGVEIIVTVEGSSSPSVATASLSGNTLTVTAGSSSGIANITVKAENDSFEKTDVFAVSVTDPNANEYWVEYGANYSFDGAVGIANAPWASAITWDFGESSVKVNTLEAGYSNPENGVTWKVTQYNGTTPSIDDVIGDLTGTFNALGGEGTVVSVNSEEVITGKVAFVFESGGNYMARDESVSTNLDGNWAYADGDWIHLSEVGFEGNWYIRAYVTTMSGIESEIVPGSTTLAQNYPNPFNPETTISFRNTMSGMVNLSVFNSNGELVKELLNSEMATGNHSVKFNALNLNAGVYFYTLTTPNASLTKKMVLVK